MSEYSKMTLEELREAVRQIPLEKPIPAPIVHALHKKLWGWIVSNADDFPAKSNWPGWDSARILTATFGKHVIVFKCFLCELHQGRCKFCPLAGCDEYSRWEDARESRYLPAYIDAARNIRDCIPED